MKRPQPQAAFDFPAPPPPPPNPAELADRGRRAWRDAVLPIVRLAVDLLTLKEVAFLLDVSPSQLADSLAERDRKRLAGEWIVVLLAAAPEPVRGELAAAIAGVGGYTVERRRELTPEQELEAMRAAIAELAPGMVPLIAERLARG